MFLVSAIFVTLCIIFLLQNALHNTSQSGKFYGILSGAHTGSLSARIICRSSEHKTQQQQCTPIISEKPKANVSYENTNFTNITTKYEGRQQKVSNNNSIFISPFHLCSLPLIICVSTLCLCGFMCGGSVVVCLCAQLGVLFNNM